MRARLVRLIRGHPYRSVCGALAASLLAGAIWIRLGPIPAELLDLSDATSTVVVDRCGLAFYEALAVDGPRSLRLDADRLPRLLAVATVAAEDRRFYSHPGVDP